MKRIVSSGLLLPSNHRQIGAFLVKRALSSEQKREELVCIFDKKLPRNQKRQSHPGLSFGLDAGGMSPRGGAGLTALEKA